MFTDVLTNPVHISEGVDIGSYNVYIYGNVRDDTRYVLQLMENI